MSRFITDTFTDATSTNLNAHTPDLGSTPSRHTSFGSGNILISGTNDCYHSNTSSAMYYYPDTPGTSEYDVVVDMTRITTVTNETMGPAGRIDTAANTVYFARYTQATGVWELFKTVAGTSTSLGTSAQTLTNGVTYNVKLEIRDAAKKIFVDGSQVVSSADNAITATGKAGLRNSGTNAAGDATGMHIDNLAVDDLLAGIEEESWQVMARMTPSGIVLPVTSDDPLPVAGVAGVIQFDAASNSGYEAALSTYNWSHTCTGANRGLVVYVGILAAGSVTSITYGAQSLTKVTGNPYSDGTYSVEAWYLVAPATGANTITVTLSASLTSIACAVSYTGVDQSTPWENNTGMSHAPLDGLPSPLLNIVTTVDNDWRIDGLVDSASTITSGTGYTTRTSNSGALGMVAVQDSNGPITPPGTASVAWNSVADTQHLAISGMALRPFVGGGGGLFEDDTKWRPPVVGDPDTAVTVWR